MSDLMGTIERDLPRILVQLTDSLGSNSKAITIGIEKLVMQGMFTAASSYVNSLDNCPKEVKGYFVELAKKQSEYDNILITQSRFGSGEPCFEGFY